MTEDYTTTRLLIQDNINKMTSKTIECDATIVDNIAFVSATLAIAKEKQAISDNEVKRFSDEIKRNLDLFPQRCSCKKFPS